MSGAVRAAWPAAKSGMGTRCETDNTVLSVATPHCAPRDASPAMATADRHARMSLVMPADAATSTNDVASAAACDAEAGVC